MWKASRTPVALYQMGCQSPTFKFEIHQRLGLDVRTRCQDRLYTPNWDQICELLTRFMYRHRGFHRTCDGVAKVHARNLRKKVIFST